MKYSHNCAFVLVVVMKIPNNLRRYSILKEESLTPHSLSVGCV